MQYDYAIDMWSIGCTLYELYTGKILFAGDSNNQMLKAIMEIRGKFSAKLYKRGELSHLHFDELGNFISAEQDKALGKVRVASFFLVFVFHSISCMPTFLDDPPPSPVASNQRQVSSTQSCIPPI